MCLFVCMCVCFFFVDLAAEGNTGKESCRSQVGDE